MNKNQAIIIPVLGITSGAVFLLVPGIFLSAAAIGLSIILLRKYSPPEAKKFLVTIFILGLGIRLFLAGGLYSISYGSDLLKPKTKNINQGETVLIGDASGYSEYGRLLSNYWKGDKKVFSSDDQVKLGNYFFTPQTYLLAFFYYVFGFTPFLGITLNCLFGALAAVFIFLITKEFSSAAGLPAKISASLICLWPSTLFWSIENTKEPLTILSLITAIWAGIKIYKKSHFLYFLLSAAGSMIFYIHQKKLSVFLFAWFAFMLTAKIWKYKSSKRLFVLIILIACVSWKHFNLSAVMIGKKNTLINITVSRNLGSYLTGGTVYKIYPDYFYNPEVYRQGEFASKMNFFLWNKALIKGIIYFLFTPFPWTLKSKLQLLSMPEIIIWYLLFPFMCVGILLSLKKKFKEIFLISVFVLMTTVIYSLSEANIGTSFRHKGLMLPFYSIFIAIGLDHCVKKIQNRGSNAEEPAITPPD